MYVLDKSIIYIKQESVDPTIFMIPKLLMLVQPDKFNICIPRKNLAGDVTK